MREFKGGRARAYSQTIGDGNDAVSGLAVKPGALIDGIRVNIYPDFYAEILDLIDIYDSFRG